jgi:hypothetical protein
VSDSSTGEVTEPVQRRAVLIVGSGRSGSSALAGTLQRLGLQVPSPEVPPDATNPRGFAESQWVVDFHTRLLKRSNVRVADARPKAWLQAARMSTNEAVREELAAWLDAQYDEPGVHELVIKDPRLSWFLGLWRAAGLRTGVEESYAISLRSPTEVVGSKQHYYAGQTSESSRMASWVNHMLHTERATRGDRRFFLRYDALLDDWTSPVYALGEALGLESVTGASARGIRRVHDFLDPGLRRVRTTWDDIDVPKSLRELAEETWDVLCLLAEVDTPQSPSYAALDDLRDRYAQLYHEAEAITQSTAAAARRRRPAPGEGGPAAAAGAPVPTAANPRRLFKRRGR